MITLRQMRYFNALASTRHFGRAAAQAHVSQPALSAQIMEMEAHLGVRLVERGRGGVTLTTKGQEILTHVCLILAETDRLCETARKGGGILEGLLRIGMIATLAPYLVPRLVPYLRARYPAIEIELKESITDRLLDDLKARRLDAVLAALPIEREGLESRHLFTDRFFMAVGGNDSRVLVSPLSEDQLDPRRLLLLEEGHCLRDHALAVCGAAGGRGLEHFGATSMTTLLQMVAHGMGMTLIPEIAVAAETVRNDLRVIPFAEPQPARRIGLVWRRAGARAGDMEALAQAVQACADRS